MHKCICGSINSGSPRSAFEHLWSLYSRQSWHLNDSITLLQKLNLVTRCRCQTKGSYWLQNSNIHHYYLKLRRGTTEYIYNFHAQITQQIQVAASLRLRITFGSGVWRKFQSIYLPSYTTSATIWFLLVFGVWAGSWLRYLHPSALAIMSFAKL